MSLQGKESRNNKTLHHITGRKPFAQIQVDQERKEGHQISRAESFCLCYAVNKGGKAKEIWDQMQAATKELNGLEDVISRDDIFARIIGPEKSRRVRMLGRGVTQQDAFEEIPSRKSCFLMIQTLRERLDKFEKNMNESSSNSAPSSSTCEDMVSTPFLTNNRRPLKVHCSVLLLSIMDKTVVVAKGYLKSMDPNTDVGGQVLGNNYYEVHVNVSVKGGEELVRPYMHFNNINDARGVSVAWPIPFVVREEDE